ncbi:MAG: TcpQ domain-containing protein [Alphaproteobacteria bacterium]|nr:TcpQ domain-containing protein [Alphaproteobacteria bacterium]
MKGRFLELIVLSIIACLGVTSCQNGWNDSDEQGGETFVIAECPVDDCLPDPPVREVRKQAPTGPGDSAIAQSKPARPRGRAVAKPDDVRLAAAQPQKPAAPVVASEPVPPASAPESAAGGVGQKDRTSVSEPASEAGAMRVVTTKITEESEKTISARNAKRTEARLVQSEQSLTTLTERVLYGEEVNDWDAAMGESLRSLLMAWGERAGWTIVWKMDRDYVLEAGVVFRGTFMDVAGALIRSFARATPAPIGTFYKGNRVLVVSIVEDENAN